MNESVLEYLKHICNISNSNIARNAEGFLRRRKEDIPVDWIDKSKVRVPPQKFEVFY